MGKTKRSGYLPSLDGWRAVSILAVLFNHSRTFFFHGHSLRALQDFGGSGVCVFFAISGLLICTRLLEEEAILGRVNLKGFYLRRTLRIQPAAIFFLLVVALVSVAGWFPQDWKYWFGSLFLYRNYQVHMGDTLLDMRGYLTGHYWTLAVEEHFYLLLSIFLYFVRSRRALVLGLAFVAALYLPQGIALFFPQAEGHDAARHTEQNLQFLIPSALIAVLLLRPAFAEFTRRWLLPGPIILLTFCYASATVYLHRVYEPAVLHHNLLTRFLVYDWWGAVYNRMFPLWVVATVTHPRSWTTRFLELPFLIWIGRISYSLYLWHILFFRGSLPVDAPQPASPLLALTHAPWNLISAFACAAASFYLLERPLMRLGHRLAPPSTPGRLDMRMEPSLEPSREPEAAKA